MADDVTGDQNPSDDLSNLNPAEVASEWQPPASMPPSPPVEPSATGGAPIAPPLAPSSMVSTGVVAEPESGRPRWFGRTIGLAAAAILIGGGGYLAINAGAEDGGADSPRDALSGALSSLSNEDLIGAAVFVEPTERETMIDAGFEVVQELIRLDVFDESLDLGSIEGFDFEFDDVEISVVDIRPGLAHLFIESGTATAEVDGASIPLGSLVTDRVDAEDLAISERNTEEMSRSDIPIVAVQRDGRWYLSLWYSVAEGALIETGTSRPGASERLAEIGGDSPERAVENFIGALEHLDMATMIGMLDPQEASALYDYAPAFVGDAQIEADRFIEEMAQEGWEWSVTDLQLRADTDGSLATVYIDRVAFEAAGPDASLEVSFAPDRMELYFDSPDLLMEFVVEGDCVTFTIEDRYDRDTQSMCTDELLAEAGLSSLDSGIFSGMSTVDEFGVVVRNVGGRWYISPIRTGSQMMLQTIRALDADAVAETVDAFISLAQDPFLLGDAFGDDFGLDDGIAIAPTTTFGVDNDFPPYTENNVGLLDDTLEYYFVFDLVEGYRTDVWWRWLAEVEELPFGEGVVANLALEEDQVVDLVVLDDLTFDSDEALAEWLGGNVVAEGDFAYVAYENDWGDSIIVARSATGIAFISSYEGLGQDAVSALRTQVGR